MHHTECLPRCLFGQELQDLGHLGFAVHNVPRLPGTLHSSGLQRWGATTGGLRIGDVQQGVLGQVMEEGLWGSKSCRWSGHQGHGTHLRGPLQPIFLHPGLKSHTDAAGQVPLEGQGGMLDVQAPCTEGRGRQPIDIRLSVMAVTRRGWPIESITGAEALVESCGDREPQKKKRATEQSISSSMGETLGSPVYER
ncbi:UNVERIFIED_CONTAM: hypothetical protein FKN15_071610 [Acipenser sinensis]